MSIIIFPIWRDRTETLILKLKTARSTKTYCKILSDQTMKGLFMEWTQSCIACFAAVWVAVALSTSTHAQPPTGDHNPRDLPILQKWSGDFPIANLDRLPEGQTDTSIGYIGKKSVFASVWKAFKPEEPVPEMDFSKNLVVYTRNVAFYNRLSIFKITLKGDTLAVMAMEIRSAQPIEDNAAMAMAVIPREGIKSIQVGNERIPVLDKH